MKNTGPTLKTRQLVIDRDDQLCRRCGGPGQQVHHRIPRGSGGTSRPEINYPANLVLVCLRCHQYVESHRTEAYAAGWLVHRLEDPETVPLFDNWGTAWVLTTDGLAVPAFRRSA